MALTAGDALRSRLKSCAAIADPGPGVGRTGTGILNRQVMSCRIGDVPTLKRKVSAWVKSRNKSGGRVRWQFTTEKARVKLQRLYPLVEG